MDASPPLVAWEFWGQHLSFVLFLICYLVTNMVGLRILAALAWMCGALYTFTTGGSGQLLSVGWSLVFVAINIAQVSLIYRERRKARLTQEEQILRERLFPKLGTVDFHYLLKAGTRQTFPSGFTLTRQGEKLDDLHVIVKGAADVLVNGHTVVTLGVGNLIGEVSFFRDDVATASVIASKELQTLCWTRTGLRSLMEEREALKLVLHESMGKRLSEIVAQRR